MKYKDKNFIKHSENQRYGEYDFDNYSTNNRAFRRKERKENKKFYKSVLINLVEKEWWDFLSIEDKNSIRSRYFFNIRYKRGFTISGFIEGIKEDFKPDIKLLRSHRLKQILN